MEAGDGLEVKTGPEIREGRLGQMALFDRDKVMGSGGLKAELAFAAQAEL
jgi:hypothetical protein